MIQILSGLLTPAIAVITVSILVLQYLLAKRRWRLDLYDRRYPVYLASMEFLSLIMQNANVSRDELVKFLRNCKDKEFLFGNDVKEHLEVLYNKGVDLIRYTSLTDAGNMEEEKRKKWIDEEMDLITWFGNQFDVTKRIFGAYLAITKK